MSVLSSIKTRLAGDAGYQAVIGLNDQGDARKLYINKISQTESPPHAALFGVSAIDIDTCKGSNGSLTDYSFQHSVYAAKYLQVDLASNAAKVSLTGFSGTIGAVTFADIRYNNRTEFYEADSKLHHIALDFTATIKT